MSHLYPESPKDIPVNFLKPKKSYYLRASLALLGILLFFVLYSTLVYFLGYLLYLAVSYPIRHINQYTIILKIAIIAGPAMLFLFALKFLFKLKNNKPKNRVKLKKEENPILWEFIQNICKETGAPKPKNIYLDPDVNAYVAYSNSWLSLILPIKKELTIGMGIIEGLNLSEFKAVMTHEFGHFAQRSMKIGSYIMTANTIIHDLIFTRDKWDSTLASWRSADIRLSITAWVITPLIWIIRQLLNLFYQFLNIMYSSLSREMEFNADKYAVSTCGSDAIVSSLWKLEPTFENWNIQMNMIYLAGQKDLFPENLYTHFHNKLKQTKKDKKLDFEALTISQLGGKKFFESSKSSSVNMYASHPANNLREENAKTPYIDCEIDERSPVLLFGDMEKLQKLVTKVIYKEYLQREPTLFCSYDDFDQFSRAELANKHLHTDFENTFEERFFSIPEEDKIKYSSFDTKTFSTDLALLKSELKTLLIPVKELTDKIKEIIEMSNGGSKAKKVIFEGTIYPKKKLNEVFQKVTNQKEEMLQERFAEWDIKFCQLYYRAAMKTNKSETLLSYYNQHRKLVSVFVGIADSNKLIHSRLIELQQKGEVATTELSAYGKFIKTQLQQFNESLSSLSEREFYPLPNIDSWDELRTAIIPAHNIELGKGAIFENGEFDRILNDIQTCIAHMQRIDLSSVGLILNLHKEITDLLVTD